MEAAILIKKKHILFYKLNIGK